MPQPLHVTHHALVRFLERVRGFKFDKEIAEIRRICASCGPNGTVKAQGCVFEVKNGNVVTVAPDPGFPNRLKREETLAALNGDGKATP
jgi:hypothetical protein